MAKKKATATKITKKPRKKKTAKKKASGDVPIIRELSISVSDDDPVLYVNYAEVSQSKYEFMLSFARIPTKPSQSQVIKHQGAETLLLAPEIQVILPPKMIQSLINVLQGQLETYEQIHGKVE